MKLIPTAALPLGGEIPEDYIFEEGSADLNEADTARQVPLSELFRPGKDTLAICSFMLGPKMKAACSMCSSIIDGLNATAVHATQRINLAVVAMSPLERLRTFARERGWNRLRLLSSGGNNYNRDYYGKTATGTSFIEVPEGEVWEMPMMNVFHRDGELIRHFWGSELFYAPTEPGQDPRHLDLVNPELGLIDLTPDGR